MTSMVVLKTLVTIAAVVPSVLLGALAGASRAKTSSRGRPKETTKVTDRPVRVLIPAHDEEHGIEGCIGRVSASDASQVIRDVVVIADNCTDDTAARARRAGAFVLERWDDAARGKGEALNWALEQDGILDGVEWMMFFDADDFPELDAVALALSHALTFDAAIVQLPHISGVPGDDLRSSAVDMWTTTLMNRVRARGFARFGLPSRLQGGGVLVDTTALERFGWPATGVSEDFFASLAFADAGVRVAFTDVATVWAESADGEEARRVQRVRWESGRIRAWSRLPGVLSTAVRLRSPAHGVLSTYIVVPPLTVHVGVLGALTIASLFEPRLRPMSALSIIGTGLYLAEGLRLLPDRRTRIGAMMAAPRFAAWKLGVFRDAALGFRTHGWSRTPRNSS